MKNRILFQLLIAISAASSTAFAQDPHPTTAPTVARTIAAPKATSSEAAHVESPHTDPHVEPPHAIKPLTPSQQRLTRGTSANELAERSMRPLGAKPAVPANETPKEISLHGSPSTPSVKVAPQVPKTVAETIAKESAFLRGLSANAKALEAAPRSVVVSGEGPSGAYSALEAYLNHPNVTVTIVDKREEHNLPIVWNQRQGTREEHTRIDPILAKGVAAVSGEIRSIEFVTLDEHGNEIGAPIVRQPKQTPVDVNGKTLSPDALANAPSVFQTKSANEMKVVWARIDQLAKKEADKAATTPGYKPRLVVLKGHEVDETPVAEGGNRRVIVRKTAEMLVNAETGEQRPIIKGQPIPAGFSKRLVKTGEQIDLGVPDLFLVAEGASSSTRNMIGGIEHLDVGPNTRYIAGYIKNVSMTSRNNEEGVGGGQAGVVRRTLRTENITGADGAAVPVALRTIAISPENLKDTWALAEVDPRLDFDKPESIRAFFNKDMSKEQAVKTYYARHIAKTMGKSEEEIASAMFDYGPTPFVLQSHIAGPSPENAKNVQPIGDAKANSHFMTSFGAVGGSTNTPIALRQYFADLAHGVHPDIARAALAKRVDVNAVAWVRAGLKEFTGTGPVNFGKAIADVVTARLGDKSFATNSVARKATDTADPTENGNR